MTNNHDFAYPPRSAAKTTNTRYPAKYTKKVKINQQIVLLYSRTPPLIKAYHQSTIPPYHLRLSRDEQYISSYVSFRDSLIVAKRQTSSNLYVRSRKQFNEFRPNRQVYPSQDNITLTTTHLKNDDHITSTSFMNALQDVPTYPYYLYTMKKCFPSDQSPPLVLPIAKNAHWVYRVV